MLNPATFVIYVCDRCPTRTRVTAGDTRMPLHNCRGRALLTVPLIPEGERAEVRAVERDDYIKQEAVQTDAEGSVFMRCEVERPDRVDVWVYAPLAYVDGTV